MWPWKRKRGSGEQSVIGSGLRIRGAMESEGELEIRGQVVGDIVHTGRLVIEAGARCESQIRADELVIAGEVHGNVYVQGQLDLLPTGRLYGDAVCARLMVAPGALFQGANRMAEPGGGRLMLPAPGQAGGQVAASLEGPLAILSEPVRSGAREALFAASPEPEVLEPVPAGAGVSAEEARALRPEGRAPKKEAPAFYGGFSA